MGGRLPNLQTPLGSEVAGAGNEDGEILPAHSIASWIDERVGLGDGDELEGYGSVEARDESHAWVALLEGDVHAALVRVSFRVGQHSISLITHHCHRHWHSRRLRSFILLSCSCPRRELQEL